MQRKILSSFDFLLNSQDTKKNTKVILYLFLIYCFLTIILTLLNFVLFPSNLYLEEFYLSPSKILENLRNNVLPFVPIIFITLVFEELLFRLPISFFINRKITEHRKNFLIMGISLLFSLYHLQYFDLLELITTSPILFIGGLIMSCVYIISGANRGKILIPFSITLVFHFMYDLVYFGILGSPFK